MKVAPDERAGSRGTKRSVKFYIAAVLLLWGLAFQVRVDDLERYPLQVDWAGYLYSAGIQDIAGHEPFATVLADDLEWVRSGHVLRKFMPHSYLHQYLMRVFYRLSLSSQLAACWGAALLGSLTCVLLIYYTVRDDAVSKAPALYAGAILGFVPFHVLYSRSGWAEIPMAMFVLVYVFASLSFCTLANGSHATLARSACWMSLVLLAAFGFHELAIASGVATVLVCLGRDMFRRLPSPRSLRLSRASFYACLSVMPSALLAIMVLRNMPVSVRAYTFSESGRYLPDVRAMFTGIFVQQDFIHQLSVPLLVLSAIGMVRLWRTRRLHFALLAVQLGCFAAALMTMPNTTMRNVRVILPVFVLMATAAAYGLEALYRATTLRRPLFHGLAAGLVCYYAYASVALIFFDSTIPWQGRYIPRQLTHAGRDAAAPLRSYIATRIRPTDAPAAFFIMEGLFYLKDARVGGQWLGYGFPSIERHLAPGKPSPHRFVLTSPNRSPPGAPEGFKDEFERGYELVSVDRLGRCGAFVRKGQAAQE